MNKRIRARKRIERDLQRKRRKTQQRAQEQYNYVAVFSYQHLVAAYQKCLRGVQWKYSVQNFSFHAAVKLYRMYKTLQSGKLPKPILVKETVIYERGKRRIITPIHINDRIVQKVLCDECLTPILSKVLIYDNGASLKGKGTDFTRKRLNMHLKQAIREYGPVFWALVFDFKGFFDSIPHKTCRRMLERYIADRDLVEITMEIIKAPYRAGIRKLEDRNAREQQLKALDADEQKGICLGSQVSQVMALIVANDLDHTIKDRLRRKYYSRYMDDGIVLGRTREELRETTQIIRDVCKELGLALNPKKTHIVRASRGFTFLKVHYCVTATGTLVKRVAPTGTVRMRRKLKKLKTMEACGKITKKDIEASMASWIEHTKIAQAYKTRTSMMKLYGRLYGRYRTKAGKGAGHEFLQTCH